MYGFILSFVSILTIQIAAWGWGRFTLQYILPHALGEDADVGLFEEIILGFPLMGCIGLSLNFISPLYPLLNFFIAILPWFFQFKKFKESVLNRTQSSQFVILMILNACMAIAALRVPIPYDVALYHEGLHNWINREPVVLGLANLHNRFGFTSIWFVIGSLVRFPFLGDASIYSLNGAMTAILLGYLFFHSAPRNPRQSFAMVHAFCFALFSFLVWDSFTRWILYINVTSTGPDFVASSYVFFTVHFILRLFEKTNTNVLRSSLMAKIFLVALFACLVKLTVLPILLSVFVCFVWIQKYSPQQVDLNALKKTCFFCLLLFFSWLIRNILVSGCLAFPASYTCFEVLPWAVSRWEAREVYRSIIAWARWPFVNQDVVLQNWAWMSHWKQDMRALHLLPRFEGFALAGLALLFYQQVKKRKAKGPVKIQMQYIFLLGTLFFGLAYWFFQAPDPRFGWGFIIPIFLVPWSYGLFISKNIHPYIKPVRGALFLWFVFNCALIPYENPLKVGEVLSWPRLDHLSYRSMKTDFGQILYLPEKGDERCDGAPLPCSQVEQKDLQWKKKGMWTIFYRATKGL